MSPLSKVPFLAHLDAADIDDLRQRMEKRTYEAGDLIYAEGTPGDGLYYVSSGTVVVLTSASHNSEIMAHLPQGSTFGETALIDDHPRSAAARAATDATILVLARSEFQAFLAANPTAGQVVRQSVLRYPARSARQLVSELLKPIPAFARLPDEALAALARKLEAKQFCANSVVFAEGQTSDALYIVESGSIQLETSDATGRAPIGIIGSHDFFGEGALLSDEARELTAIASSAADLWALHRADFDALAETNPAAVLALTRAFAVRSEHLNRQLLTLATAAAPAVRPVTRPVAVPALTTPARPIAVRPATARRPLFAGLRSWFGGLPMLSKAWLGLASVLLAWLMLVSVPTLVSGSLNNASNAILPDSRSMTMASTSRGADSVRGADTAAVPVTDNSTNVAEAPMAALADVVEIKPVVPTPTVAPTPAATPSPTTAAPAAPTTKYTVVSGDSLWGIATDFNVDLDVLTEANDMTVASTILPGDEMIIPGGAAQAEIAAKLAANPRPAPDPVAVAPAKAAARPGCR